MGGYEKYFYQTVNFFLSVTFLQLGYAFLELLCRYFYLNIEILSYCYDAKTVFLYYVTITFKFF